MPDDPDNQPVERVFKREDRFIVVKRKHLISDQAERIADLFDDLGIRTVECVVVESDWPEYETVWAMIEARVTGNTRAAPPADIAKIIESVLPDVHMSISDGQYGFAARQIASALRHTDNPRTDVVDATIAELTKDREYYAERYADRCGQLIVRDAEIARLNAECERRVEANSISFGQAMSNGEAAANARAEIAALNLVIGEAVEIIAVLSETAADFTEVDQATHERARTFLARQQSLGVDNGEG